MANFSTFFAKVRYLPYNAKKCAKISHFFKRKNANSRPFSHKRQEIKKTLWSVQSKSLSLKKSYRFSYTLNY